VNYTLRKENHPVCGSRSHPSFV
jgi:hypothetical protein